MMSLSPNEIDTGARSPCKSIRTVNEKVPIIALAASSTGCAARVPKTGMQDDTGKPFTPHDLYLRVNKYL